MSGKRKAIITILLLLALTLTGVFLLPVGAAAGPQPGDIPLRNNGIPVIMLTIDPAEYQALLDSPRHEYRAEKATLRIDVPEGYTCEYGGIDEAALGRELELEYIRGRGNSTWLQETKKAYKFKLADAADLLAMGENKHWVLMANAKDRSLVRNRIASYLGSAIGMDYTPRFVPVDLVINGCYMGSYCLGEQVRIDESRINIDKIKKSDTEEPEISGGYLLAMDPYGDEAAVNIFETESGLRFLLEKPDLSEYAENQEEALTAQKSYIEAYIQQVENAIFGEDFRDASGTSYRDLMDIESAACYWWVQEFSYNSDGFASASTYLYKVRGGKLYWGPLWDFDRAFWLEDSSWAMGSCRMPWLDHLRAYDPVYQDMLREVWKRMEAAVEELIRDGGVLDRYRNEIALSWENDRELWHADSSFTIDDEIRELKLSLRIRRDGIAENLEEQLTLVFPEETEAEADPSAEDAAGSGTQAATETEQTETDGTEKTADPGTSAGPGQIRSNGGGLVLLGTGILACGAAAVCLRKRKRRKTPEPEKEDL